MKEEAFRSELYRQIINKLDNKAFSVEIEKSAGKEIGANMGEIDITIYYKNEPVMLIETKNSRNKLSAAVTQVYRYALFSLADRPGRYVTVCSPDTIEIYKYDCNLGKWASITPKDVENGTLIGDETFDWSTQSKKRILMKHYFQETEAVGKIAEIVVNFLKNGIVGEMKNEKYRIV